MKKISILGSTGSIGRQTLDVARNLEIKVCALTANSNIDLLEKQAREFKPELVAVYDETLAGELKIKLKDTGVKVISGMQGLVEAAVMYGTDMVVTSIVGTAGLIPTIEAVKAGKDIAIANKESLVAAGEIVMSLARAKGVRILPVDSEHSAIFQCLEGNNLKQMEKIILTASGGPFRGKNKSDLRSISPAEALKHPNWNMGCKITIDSATLMNKGLEVIEAFWLFGAGGKKIRVVVHPQSIIHSMVEFIDGSVIAQLGSPDMRIPIQYALTYPQREASSFSKLNLLEVGNLTFEEPDIDTFACLGLAYRALAAGGTMPAVMNAANEAAVVMFLDNKISFLDIPDVIEKVMDEHSNVYNYKIDEVLQCDRWSREKAYEICREDKKCKF